MCLILKSEGAHLQEFKLGQAAVQNNLPDLKRCVRARQEETLTFMQDSVQGYDKTVHSHTANYMRFDS